jgi:hypothetical protein
MQAFTRAFRRLLYSLLALAVLGGIGYLIYGNYGWVFSKNVRGEVIRNERVTNPTAILSGRLTPEMLYSYAILIRAESGEFVSTSSEDRQWSVVAPGYCVVARLYPYPFWELEKGGTYANARVEKVFDCPGKKPGAAAGQAPGVLPDAVPSAAMSAPQAGAPAGPAAPPAVAAPALAPPPAPSAGAPGGAVGMPAGQSGAPPLPPATKR